MIEEDLVTMLSRRAADVVPGPAPDLNDLMARRRGARQARAVLALAVIIFVVVGSLVALRGPASGAEPTQTAPAASGTNAWTVPVRSAPVRLFGPTK